MMILGILALVMVPAMTLAKSHNGGHGSSQGGTSVPTPNPSAYEHADEKARFMRDTHDMGKHQGQEMPEGEGQDKDKNQDKGKDKDKSKGEDQGAANDKDKSKETGKGSTAEGKDKSAAGKEKGLGAEQEQGKGKGKESGTQTDAGKLLEQGHKTKEEKVK
jgi:hypothetical protein